MKAFLKINPLVICSAINLFLLAFAMFCTAVLFLFSTPTPLEGICCTASIVFHVTIHLYIRGLMKSLEAKDKKIEAKKVEIKIVEAEIKVIKALRKDYEVLMA